MEENCVKVFPWTNRGEFKRVFQELYSNKKSLQKHALDRIEVWKTRVAKLPVAVDATAQLVRYSIHDLADADRSQALGFMLMKFVNNITEERQQKFHKKTIVYIASEMGIDRWIVNLRHQIAHGDIPSLHVLQAAVKWSLNWLKVNFWMIQVQQPEDPDSPMEERLAVLKRLFDDYLKKTYRQIMGRNTKPVDEVLLERIDQALFGLGDNSFSVLVEPGYLIPTKKTLSKLRLTTKAILREPCGLPDLLYQLWCPVLMIMDKIGLIPRLLLHLVSVLSPDPSFTNRCVYGWMYTILVHRETWTSDIPYRQLLDIAVQITNQYAMPVLLLLIDLVDENLLPKARKAVLVQELERSYNSLNMEESSGKTDHYNIHQLTDESFDMKNSIWTKCFDQVNWSRYPFGSLPNHTLSYKNLELDWSENEEEEELDANEGENMDTENEMDSLNGPQIHSVNHDAIGELVWDEDKVKQIMEGIILF